MKFMMTGYKPQKSDGSPEAETYPETREGYSERMRDIRHGIFSTVLQELGPIRRFGEEGRSKTKATD